MRRHLALAAVALGVAVGAQAGEEPGDWLMKMGPAARTTNYQGVMVYRADNVLETFRVMHGFDDKGVERERVQSLTGEVREILKQKDETICILPKDERLTMSRPATPKALFGRMSPERLTALQSVYEIKELDKQRVGGRMCRGIAIAPRDKFRYGYEIWADSETGVPLKVTLSRPDKQVVEQMFFSEVEFPATIKEEAFRQSLPPEAVRQATSTAATAITEAVAEEPLAPHQDAAVLAAATAPPSSAASPATPAVAGDPTAQPTLTGLPPGFRLVRKEIRPLPNGQGVVEHVIISDGMNAISVFRSIQRIDTQAMPERGEQMGAVNVYSMIRNGRRVTAVGEAPSETVRMAGEAMAAEDPVPQPTEAVAAPSVPAPTP